MPVRPGLHTGQKKFLENGANRKKLIFALIKIDIR